jgi:hypothetical protein
LISQIEQYLNLIVKVEFKLNRTTLEASNREYNSNDRDRREVSIDEDGRESNRSNYGNRFEDDEIREKTPVDNKVRRSPPPASKREINRTPVNTNNKTTRFTDDATKRRRQSPDPAYTYRNKTDPVVERQRFLNIINNSDMVNYGKNTDDFIKDPID